MTHKSANYLSSWHTLPFAKSETWFQKKYHQTINKMKIRDKNEKFC